jgi:molybdate transport system regulatory protein
MSEPRVTIRVDFAASNSIGPGKIALLEKLQESGSLSQAARDLGMSYRRGWQLLDSLNRSFDEPLAVTAVGGSGGGGSELTPLGRAIVRAYRGFEKQANRRAQRTFKPFVLATSVSKSGGGSKRSLSRSRSPALRAR